MIIVSVSKHYLIESYTFFFSFFSYTADYFIYLLLQIVSGNVFAKPRKSLETAPSGSRYRLPPYLPVSLPLYLDTCILPSPNDLFIARRPAAMDAWEDDEPEYCKGDYAAGPGSKDIYVQLVISVALGFTALFAFCVSAPEPAHLDRLPVLKCYRCPYFVRF